MHMNASPAADGSPNGGSLSRRVLLKRTAGAAALASLAGLLEACAKSASTSPSPASGTAINSGVGKASGQPIKQLKLGLPGSLSNLYPGVEAGILNYYIAALAMEGLVSVLPSGETVPALASSWSRPNASTYVYTIRPDAKFADGTPLAVSDVLYSITMAQSAKASPGTASYLSGIKTVKQTGASEITITLSAPNESFEWALSAAGELWVAPEAYWKKYNGAIGTPQALLNGTGPYKVTSFQPDSGVQLEASGTWWGGKPPVESISVSFISDDNARYLATKSGAINMSLNVPLESLSQWQSLPGHRVLSVPDRSWVGLTFNMNVAPTSDIHVRNAIAHCIDRNAVVSELLKGQGQLATAISTPEQFTGVYTPAQATAKMGAIPQLDFSIDAAKQELAKSSVPHGFTLTLEYPNTGPQLGTAALSLAQNLKQIGVTLNVKEVALSQWLNDLGSTKTPLNFMWYFNTTPDPAELVSYLLVSGANPANYKNAKVDGLINQALVETDAGQRADLILQSQQVAAADLPYLPLWWGRSLTSFADTIGTKNFTSYTFESPWASFLYSAS
jgi:peptide/nickel transport system substrate-binding protein